MQKVIHDYINCNPLFDYIDKLYWVTSDTDENVDGKSLIKPSYPLEFKGIISIFNDEGYYPNMKFSNMKFPTLTSYPKIDENNKNIIICVSGGKDSLATTLYYKNLGYDIILYHMKGINKCYPDEYRRVEEIATYLGVDVYFDNVKLSGNHVYIEHPLKNFILVNGAIHFAITKGIGNIALGDFQSATLDDNAFEISGGDCKELWCEYENIISSIIPNFRLFMPLNSVKDSFEILEKDKNLLALSQSCMGTFRFREFKRTENMKKYGVELMPHRCGSCWKCALEYIYYTDKNILDFNEGYYKYCLDILLRDMKDNGKIPYTPEFIWYNYLFYDISESKLYEELRHAIVQSRKIKYNSEEIAREVYSPTILSD